MVEVKSFSTLSNAKVNTPSARLTCRFLPALNVSLLPALTASPSSPVVAVTSSSELSAFANHLALLTAFTTVSTVASLPASVFDGSRGSL